MEINIEINNLTKTPVPAGLIKKAARIAIESELKDKSPKSPIEVSVACVGPRKIRRLNKEHRQIDHTTDVLSFSQGDGLERKDGLPMVLGELIICPAVVKKDAQEVGISFSRQMGWVAVHGILHLLGYDHERDEAAARRMRQKEEFYLSKLKIENEKGKTKIKN